MTTPALETIAQLLREDVIGETDDPEIRFQARSMLQHLVVIEDRLRETEPPMQ